MLTNYIYSRATAAVFFLVHPMKRKKEKNGYTHSWRCKMAKVWRKETRWTTVHILRDFFSKKKEL